MFLLLNEWKKKRADIRFKEKANSKEQLALGKLVSDKMWDAIALKESKTYEESFEKYTNFA